MKNPVPEIALPYVCDYFQVLLKTLLIPVEGITGTVSGDVVARTGMPDGIAKIVQHLLVKRGFVTLRGLREPTPIGARVWYQLTARGYLTALELQRQKQIDGA